MIGETERILVCCGRKCAGNSAQAVANAIEEELAKRGYDGVSSVEVVRTGCAGECDQGPIVRLMPNDVTYYRVGIKHVAALVDSLSATPMKRLLFKKKRQFFEKLSDNPFFGLQCRIALQYVGVVDPLNLEDFIAHGGYSRLQKAQDMEPIAIIEKLRESGLRIKCPALESPEMTRLEANRQAPSRIVCNINANGSSDPVGISLAEGSPHAVIEGMALAMHATRAREGVFTMRQKDKAASDAMRQAIEDALASDIFASTPEEPRCAIAISVTDESAAQACKIEEPRNESAVHLDKNAATTSTILSIDAETLAALPFALGEGFEPFSRMNVDAFKETKAFALEGKAKHIGFVEVPMGTPFRKLLFKIGGGVAGDRPFKSIRVGGMAGIYLPDSLLDVPIDFDSFAHYGIPADAGSINVLDDRTCIVKTVRNDLRQLYAQSSSIGLAQSEDLRTAIALLERLCSGNGEPNDSELLNQIGLSIRSAATTRCERMAANSLLSSIEHFRSEYEAHALEKRCPAGNCPKLTQFTISPEACAGCDACSNACPSDAIIGEQRQPHTIDYDKCISCGTCRDVCRFHAVLTERKPLAE